MLSYRHAFHAGNHGDLLKHLVLLGALDYFIERGKDFVYIDSHAGAGLYRLRADGEAQDGYLRLADRDDLPPLLAELVALQRQQGPQHYAGSPLLVASRLATLPRDGLHYWLRLFELHPSDRPILENSLKRFRLGRRLQLQGSDGFAGLLASLPPTPRRALVLIDPSYELKTDYRTALHTLEEARKRFATGCYLLWYPRLARLEVTMLERQLPKRFGASYLHAQLQIGPPNADGFGLWGSGVFVINPPYTLAERLRPELDYLARQLGNPGTATLNVHLP